MFGRALRAPVNQAIRQFSSIDEILHSPSPKPKVVPRETRARAPPFPTLKAIAETTPLFAERRGTQVMATLISGSGANGRERRCDAKCHNAATDPKHCKCICGGYYHGAARRGNLEGLHINRPPEVEAEAKALAEQLGFTIVFHPLTVQGRFTFDP